MAPLSVQRRHRLERIAEGVDRRVGVEDHLLATVPQDNHAAPSMQPDVAKVAARVAKERRKTAGDGTVRLDAGEGKPRPYSDGMS